MMFVARLAETISANDAVINCTDPGATKGTAFFREVDSWAVKQVLAIIQGIIGRATADGARIYVHSALVLGKESHGSYTDWIIRS